MTTKAKRMKVPKVLQLRLLQDEIEAVCKRFGVRPFLKAADAAMVAIAKVTYDNRGPRGV